MDFVVGLPESEGYGSIWVAVDRLTRQSHLAPRTAQTTAEASAGLVPGHVFGSHELPDSIDSAFEALLEEVFSALPSPRVDQFSFSPETRTVITRKTMRLPAPLFYFSRKDV